jgi:hypothetical protein
MFANKNQKKAFINKKTIESMLLTATKNGQCP